MSAFAPVVSYIVYEWTQRKEIDEHKLINLFLGVGTYGLLMVGLLNWGNPQSGYFGLEEGDYAFQHAEMNVLWQVIGIVVCIGVGLVTAWILGTILQRTIGLREDEETIVDGFDVAPVGHRPRHAHRARLERRGAGGARGSRRRAAATALRRSDPALGEPPR